MGVRTVLESNNQQNVRDSKIGLRTKIAGLLLGVMLVLSAIFIAYTYVDQRNQTTEELLEKSRVLVLEMDAVWKFVSLNQDTINYTSDGDYDYKGIHCAIAGKSVAVLFSETSEYSISFTNQNPRNIHNTPDEYENKALEAFASDPGVTELYGYEELEGVSVFRYVSAMEVTEDCVDCHGGPVGEIDETGYPKEGWKTGDLAGAVSVVVPAERSVQNMQESIVMNVGFFAILMLCMTVVVYVVFRKLVTDPLGRLKDSFAKMGDTSISSSESFLEPAWRQQSARFSSYEMDELFNNFDAMAKNLLDLYANLESQVSERTAELSRANEQLEKQRKHTEEVNALLAQDNRYKSDFLAIVSHELRTPLTSILAFAELLVDNVDQNNPDALRQLEEIRTNGAILLEMVENVLETARIQAGKEQVNLELIDLSDIVGMVSASLEPVAMQKGVRLNTLHGDDVPLITGDWEKMRRIVTNLVSNALKFTPEGGRVDVWVRTDAGKRFVTIEVTDTGIGIPKDKQELIFERFTQENMSTARRYGGSGLGLSLVKDLVLLLGGEIKVTSELGQGSTFCVVLPVVEGMEGADLWQKLC